MYVRINTIQIGSLNINAPLFSSYLEINNECMYLCKFSINRIKTHALMSSNCKLVQREPPTRKHLLSLKS